jgi:tRNA(His) guanylyltransferase
MLAEKGILWADEPLDFRYGLFVQRRKVLRRFTTDELENLPPMHDARKNPDLEYERKDVFRHGTTRVDRLANPKGFLFSGQPPLDVDSPDDIKHAARIAQKAKEDT